MNINSIDLRLLRCPISMTLCYDPVIVEDGYTYERRSIDAHFKIKETSPMTNENIGTSLISNLILKQIIQNVLKSNFNLQKEFEESKKEYFDYNSASRGRERKVPQIFQWARCMWRSHCCLRQRRWRTRRRR